MNTQTQAGALAGVAASTCRASWVARVILGDHGVLKVSHPQGDDTRASGPFRLRTAWLPTTSG